MMKKFRPKKALITASFLFLAFFAYKNLFDPFARADTLNFSDAKKMVALDDNGSLFNVETKAETVSDFLAKEGIALGEYDRVIPEKQSAIYPGIQIRIERAVHVKIACDGRMTDSHFTEKTNGAVLASAGISLGHLDKVSPDISARPFEGSIISVTRINIEEVTETEEIDFKTITNNDPKMGWRDQKVTQDGIKGAQEVKYRITYKDGKEVSRIILEKSTTQQPVPQIVTQGTYMELGKASKGQGTWYAFKGGFFAASTSIPRGSYARITNLANGRSVVVQINDYGPQGEGRIIDLDKVAFAKIASLGAGVIGVKVEQVLN